MHSAIQIRHEARRGCGYRKVGGFYFVADGPAIGCGRLPVPLGTCPICGSSTGLERGKPSRGWTWVQGGQLLKLLSPECSRDGQCASCVVNRIITDDERAGLLWVGQKFYKTPSAFNDEAQLMGISRRISQVPHGFVVGQTPVLLAHRGCFTNWTQSEGITHSPSIFRVFIPQRIEIVVSGDESDEVIEGYLKRGMTPVLVKHLNGNDQQPTLMEDEEE